MLTLPTTYKDPHSEVGQFFDNIRNNLSEHLREQRRIISSKISEYLKEQARRLCTHE